MPEVVLIQDDRETAHVTSAELVAVKFTPERQSGRINAAMVKPVADAQFRLVRLCDGGCRTVRRRRSTELGALASVHRHPLQSS
jgi:hypothetical protein